MNIDELHPNLRREYQESLGCGIEKISHPKCQDMPFVVPPPPPRDLPKNLSVKAIAESTEIMIRQPNLDEATDLDRLISYLFLRKEAVESSRMEGTMSTIEHVLTPGELFDDLKAKSEGASVRGYAHALENELQRVRTQGSKIFTIDLVSRLHTETMKFDPKFRGIPGQPREVGKPGDIVWIRGHSPRPEDSIYNPPPASHVIRCLRETMGWFADAQLIEHGNAGIGMPLVVRMAIGHAHFEGIHPFSDGNGRVGRMLITLQMASQGKLPIYLSGYIEDEKLQYNHALQEAQKRLNYSQIVEFLAEAIKVSHQEARRTQDLIEQLPSIWKTRGTFRKDSTAEFALSWLITCPIFTAKQLQERFQVSPQAAHTAVELLQKRGVIRERTGFERNRLFAAEEVIALLSRRFGSDPKEAIAGAQNLIEQSNT